MTEPDSLPSIDLAIPDLLDLVGLGCELLVADLRRDGLALPPGEASSHVKAIIALRRAHRARQPQIAIPPAANCAHDVGVSDAVQILGVTTEQRVRQMAASGELPGQKDERGRWTFRRADVDRCAEGRRKA